MAIPAEQVTKLQAAHPGVELHFLKNIYGEVVARVPTPEEYEKFTIEATDTATRTSAFRMLVHACVVHPPEAEFLALLAKRPAIVYAFGNRLLEIAGLEALTESKKL